MGNGRPLIIQKYGGSSLAGPRLIRKAAQRIKLTREKGADLVTVVSAMGHSTDHLIRLAHRTVPTPPQRELDMLLTAGERISMSLLAMALEAEGIPAISFTGSQVGIVTSNHHNEARIVAIRAHRLQEEIAKGKVVIVAGFQGVSEQREVTTLGRGGSDTTAVALAANLGALHCEILTDVEGIFTADPRLVPKARVVSQWSYDEALEFSSLGAKLHPRSLELARRFEVPVWVSSSLNAESPGTWIRKTQEQIDMEATRVSGIATQSGFTWFQMPFDLATARRILEQLQYSARFLDWSPKGFRFLCSSEKVAQLEREVSSEWAGVLERVDGVGTVSLVGNGFCTSAEPVLQFLEILQEEKVEPLLLVSNALSITAAVRAQEIGPVARRLHTRFLEKDG